MLFIFFPDVCDTMCSAWFYFRLMDLALSSDVYQGAEATCSSTVFSPSPDWAKQIEDFTNVMWQAVHPSTKQIPQLLSMVSFRISHLDAWLKYAFERLYISDLDIYTPCQTAYPPLMDSNSLFTAFYLSYSYSLVCLFPDQPFIRLKHRDGPVVEASAGQKSFRLTPKLRAFPAPEVIW